MNHNATPTTNKGETKCNQSTQPSESSWKVTESLPIAPSADMRSIAAMPISAPWARADLTSGRINAACHAAEKPSYCRTFTGTAHSAGNESISHSTRSTRRQGLPLNLLLTLSLGFQIRPTVRTEPSDLVSQWLFAFRTNPDEAVPALRAQLFQIQIHGFSFMKFAVWIHAGEIVITVHSFSPLYNRYR